ncbi:MAG TPA: type II secretion system protein, partial [Desulfitobacterium dehalogenans]|nr:type II secretion system protein [Desulfitobacterium dehalogenans]
MQNIRGNQKERLDRIGQDRGFTLIEVLFALLITGILLTVALRFFYGEWNTSRTIKDKMEAHYAVVTA